jgi:hypothetical protein
MTAGKSSMAANLSTARELLAFFWQGRNWWLTPVIVILLLASAVVVFLESSAIAPFIYALF